jgi:hypothetical protein
MMTRIAPFVIAALGLGLSACTNPYDPVQRGLGGGVLGGFWCCHRSSGGWRAGSGPRSSDWRCNRDIRGSCEYTSAATGHLFRLPDLRISRLRIFGLWVSGLHAARLWISGLLGKPCLLRSSGLWISRLFGTARFPRTPDLWIPRLLGTTGLSAL